MNIFEALEFEVGIKELKQDLPNLKEYYKTAAQAMYSYFDSLHKSGFTQEQALEIVIAHGFSPEASSTGKYEGPFRYDTNEED